MLFTVVATSQGYERPATDLSTVVPYSGATSDVDLGIFNLKSNSILGNTTDLTTNNIIVRTIFNEIILGNLTAATQIEGTSLSFRDGTGNNTVFHSGNLNINSVDFTAKDITATEFIKQGATSNDILLGDGTTTTRETVSNSLLKSFFTDYVTTSASNEIAYTYDMPVGIISNQGDMVHVHFSVFNPV